MSLVLLESSIPTITIGVVFVLVALAALAFVMNVGAGRPHS
ncbi:hypothetical protein [Luteococcus sp. OSA5]